MDSTTTIDESRVGNYTLWTLGVVLGLALSLQQFLPQEGILLDDELTHFSRSLSAWANTELIFDAWTRPGRNLIHMVAAPLGLTATRVYTLGLLFVGMLATAAIARRLELPRIALIPMLFFFQQWVVELGYGVLTQTPFLVVWVVAVLFHLQGRERWAAVFFGYLLLVRHEGAAISAAYFALSIWNRKFAAAMLVFVPGVMINAAAWLCSVRLPFHVFLEAKPTEMYGSGPLWHYAWPTFEMVGVPLSCLAVVGLPRMIAIMRTLPVLASYPLYFLVHSVIYWRGLFASGGYVYFLMPMAPFFAWAGLCGIDVLLKRLKKLPTKSIPAGHIVVGLLIAGLFLQSYTKPRRIVLYSWSHPSAKSMADFFPYVLRGSPVEEDGMREPVRQAIRLTNRLVDSDASWQTASMSPYFHYRTNQIQTREIRSRQWIGIEQLPPKTLFVWESQYAPHSAYAREKFEASDWAELASFGDERVIVFSNAASAAQHVIDSQPSISPSLDAPRGGVQ